jgi:hypothetical protein
MDERDMEKEGKNNNRKGIEIKMLFFGIVIFIFIVIP